MKKLKSDKEKLNQYHEIAAQFYQNKDWKMHAFQKEVLQKVVNRCNGLLTAPTGSGKTLALALPQLIRLKLNPPKSRSISMIWISPLRSLSQDICDAINRAAAQLDILVTAEVRNGDTSQKDRLRQKKHPPDILITTPGIVVQRCSQQTS